MSRPNRNALVRRTDDIRAELAAMSRSPFTELLAAVLESAPSPEALKAIAEKNPDRWAQALAIVARLAGYDQRLEVRATFHEQVHQMSDAELAQRIAALAAGREKE